MTHIHLSELGNDILKAIYPYLTQTFVPLSEIQEILRLAFDTTDRSKLIRAMHDLSTISSSSTIQVRIITTQQQLLISAKSEVSKGRMISCFGTFQYTTQTTPLLTRQQLATQLLHHHPLPLIIVDRQWSIKLLNQAAIRIVGRPKEQLEMQSLTSIFPQIADTFELDNHLPTALVHTKTSARFKDAQWSVVEVGIQSVVHHGQTHFMVMWQTTAQQKLTTPPPSTSDVVSDSLAQQADSNIISQNAAYQMVLQQIAQVAATNTTVLILGETGTGKELLAKSVHRQSTRMNYPLVKVNCAALPENLIESELFGHEAGAFTGATGQKIGRFELADGGTIFLDEIGELPIELQPKLLRVLQEGEFERVGGSETIKTDVRVIAATNRDLVQLIEKGGFREDLYYRLHVFPIHNIPLRERRDDIPLLVKHFIQKYSKKNSKNIHDIQVKALKKLMGYDFPGNIRELENIVERGIILTQGKKLSLDHWHPTQRRTN
ncbi:MAG: sigma 54-interacting transcriptional regulator, partial [Bacteroidota bacterium]